MIKRRKDKVFSHNKLIFAQNSPMAKFKKDGRKEKHGS